MTVQQVESSVMVKDDVVKKLDIDREQVKRSVDALWQYVQKSKGLDAGSLLDFSEQVNMQLGFNKIPSLKGNKTIKIRLDHTLMQDNQDVCLFVKDLDKKKRDYSDTVDHFTELLEKHNVSYVTQIIPLKALKKEYKPFEAKRNLSDMYEFFLADERIGALLPQQLGKHFLNKKRHPVPVNLKAKDLKKELDRAMKTSLCVITGRGSTCQVKVAHTGLDMEAAVENIINAAETLATNIPGGPNNVKTLHIKTFDSPSIPIYVSQVDPNTVKVPKESGPSKIDEPEELTTITGAKVVVRPAGQVHVIPDGQEFEFRPRKRVRNEEAAEAEADEEIPVKVTKKPKKRNNTKPGTANKTSDSIKNPFGRSAETKSKGKNIRQKKSALKGKPPKIRKMN